MTPSRAEKTKEHLHYPDTRHRIQDGDILLWSGSSLSSRVFRYLTNSHYSHAAIVAWWDDRLMVLQSEWVGIQAVPLSRTVWRYDGLVDWYRITDTHRQQLDLNRLLSEAKKDLGLAFDTVGVVRSLWHRVLRGIGIIERWMGHSLPRRSAHVRAMFCSEYVAHCFNRAGLPLADRLETDTLPGDIAASDKLKKIATLRNPAYRRAARLGALSERVTGPVPPGL